MREKKVIYSSEYRKQRDEQKNSDDKQLKETKGAVIER